MSCGYLPIMQLKDMIMSVPKTNPTLSANRQNGALYIVRQTRVLCFLSLPRISCRSFLKRESTAESLLFSLRYSLNLCFSFKSFDIKIESLKIASSISRSSKISWSLQLSSGSSSGLCTDTCELDSCLFCSGNSRVTNGENVCF